MSGWVGAEPVAAVVVVVAGGLAAACRWAGRGIVADRVLDRVVGEVRSEPSAVPVWFTSTVARLDLPVDTASCWPWARRLAVVGGLVLAVAEPRWGAVAVGLALGVAAWTRRRRRVAEPSGEDVTAVVEGLIGPLVGGASLAQAVGQVVARDPAATVARVLAPVARDIAAGQSTASAFDRWASRRGDDRARLLADALAVSGASGGSQAKALLGVGATLRERDALDREIRALGSQARASAVVLAVSPLAFTAVAAALDRRVAGFLLVPPAGWLCLIAGAIADLVGWRWMRRIVAGASW